LAVAVGAVLAVYFANFGRPEKTDGPALLSLAVLPFSSSDKSEPDLAVDSFTREVSSGLAQAVLGRAVVSADAASVYQGALAEPRKAGKDLNVRYVGRIQLVDATH